VVVGRVIVTKPEIEIWIIGKGDNKRRDGRREGDGEEA
jgi:hypothetical protein